MYAQDELLPWARAIHGDVPGIDLYDAHTHLGLHDPSGLLATDDELLEAIDQVGSRALVFPLKEPGGYGEPNDRMLELSDRHPGRLRALCRLDPAAGPVAEAIRCLEAGAVGLKLHPRGDGFEIADDRLDGIFALADRQHLPIMVHGGVGDPAVVVHAIERARENPGARIILAHCAVGGFERLLPHVDELTNVFVDTSWWNPGDIWGLMRLVPPSRILYASDIPFSSPALAMVLTARTAVQAGLGPDQIRSIMGGQLDRLVAREEPLDVGPQPDDIPSLPADLERLYVTLCTTVEPMLRGEPPGQGLDLARTCTDTPFGPQSDVIESVGALLDLADGHEEPDPLRSQRTPGWDLVLAAAVVARTPDAALPASVPAD